MSVRGEQEFAVPLLGLPSMRTVVTLEKVAQASALQIFVPRAHAIQPGFVLTEALCFIKAFHTAILCQVLPTILE